MQKDQLEGNLIINMRGDGGIDQKACSRGSDKWSHSRNILKVQAKKGKRRTAKSFGSEITTVSIILFILTKYGHSRKATKLAQCALLRVMNIHSLYLFFTPQPTPVCHSTKTALINITNSLKVVHLLDTYLSSSYFTNSI